MESLPVALVRPAAGLRATGSLKSLSRSCWRSTPRILRFCFHVHGLSGAARRLVTDQGRLFSSSLPLPGDEGVDFAASRGGSELAHQEIQSDMDYTGKALRCDRSLGAGIRGCAMRCPSNEAAGRLNRDVAEANQYPTRNKAGISPVLWFAIRRGGQI